MLSRLAALLRRSPAGSRVLRPELATLLIAAFFLLCCNLPFWRHLLVVEAPVGTGDWGLLAAGFVFLLLVLNALLTLLAFPCVFRPVVSVLLIATALVAYFMNQYGVMIDAHMVQSAVETDLGETRDLLTIKMLVYLLLLGVLPVWLLWRAPLRWRPAPRELLAKLVVLLISALLIVGIALMAYQNFASVARNHRELRDLLTPTNYLQASVRFLKQRYKTAPAALTPIGLDAKRPAAGAAARPSLTVIVVGETARADHFSLNGYPRDTNPLLRKQSGLISLGNVHSCGTETAVSVPCMFSGMTRAQYSDAQAHSQQGLLDVLQRAGLAVRWRDNQAGCKGVCDRVPNQNVSNAPASALCPEGECLDMALLAGLGDDIDKQQHDAVLVLHMMGSHGPAYYKRYPAGFEVFMPACQTSQLDRCTQQQLVNGFDNSLRYTDHVLSSLIDLLRSKAATHDTAMIYLSDHGESLGEHNLYLHGTPYLIAPEEQKHVPMLLWFSDGYLADFRLDAACMNAHRNDAYSHDNLFHSVLGLLSVQTAIYQPGLDLFAGCRR
ncbi:phosphoethanolamine transferase [Andreprevotia sp. IGB-42]|uniref:phosphoethanolamine transferase n=1 Tax=Andreprevotia sp. IGB-42 TaxID=2497473 RepID=UPI00135C6FC1|nr:phosphoethanolamine--lipid A transferase [Andreprevotia sp. IGB-42]